LDAFFQFTSANAAWCARRKSQVLDPVEARPRLTSFDSVGGHYMFSLLCSRQPQIDDLCDGIWFRDKGLSRLLASVSQWHASCENTDEPIAKAFALRQSVNSTVSLEITS